MPFKFPPIATADEIRTLAKRALAVLDALGDHEDDDSDREAARAREHQAYRMAKDALRFCASAAAVLGDGSLVALLTQIREEQERWEPHGPDDNGAVDEGLSGLLANRVVPPPPEPSDLDTTDEDLAFSLAPLVAHPDPDRRSSVAIGLQPTSPRAIALLEQLAQDPSVTVRAPAKKRLAKVREVPWWWGKLSEDPATRLEPDELAAHSETLTALSELLDLDRRPLGEREEELVRLIGALPDVLAIDAAEKVLAGNVEYGPQFERVGTLLATRPRGAEAFVRLCEAWQHGGRRFSKAYMKMVEDAPREARLAVCMELARSAFAGPSEQRLEIRSATCLRASIAAGAFPLEEEVDPLIELSLALPYEQLDFVASSVSDALVKPGARVSAPMLERMIEARLAGYPGSWRALWRGTDQIIRALPREQLRPVAEAAIRSDDEQTVAYGLLRRCLEAHDPENDPEPAEVLRRLGEERRLMRVIALDYHLARMATPWLRERLRAGSLRFDEALKLTDAVHALWGGKVDWQYLGAPKLAEERAKVAAFLGSEEQQGPFTEEEWAALRRLRAVTPLDDVDDMFCALFALPAGPAWDPEDEALFARALERVKAGESRLTWPMAEALKNKPSLDKLPLFEVLLAHEPDIDDKERIREARTRARWALGLRDEPEPGEDGEMEEDPAGVAWMDEEDDEDDD